MKQALASSTTSAWYAAPFSFLDRLAKHAFLSFFQKLQYGKILLIDRTEHYLFGGESANFPLSVTVQVHNSQFYKDVIFGGDVGAGESYINGLWSCDDLTALVRIMVRNRHILDT